MYDQNLSVDESTTSGIQQVRRTTILTENPYLLKN